MNTFNRQKLDKEIESRKEAYRKGEKEGVIKFAGDLISEINACKNVGHSLDIIAFSENYINQYL